MPSLSELLQHPGLMMPEPKRDSGGKFPELEDQGYDHTSDYDYAAAEAAGVPFNPIAGQHGDSRFKKDWHERRFLPSSLGIFDTKYSRLVPALEFQLQATPIQKAFVYGTSESIPGEDILKFMRGNNGSP